MSRPSIRKIFMRLRDIADKQHAFARWIGIGLLFLIISWAHMGSSLTHAGTEVLNNPGDHTAGIMYNSWVSPNSPIPGFSHLTNYPFGENLRQPLALSTLVPSTIHLSISKFSNIVFGWNMLVLLGYMSNALLMFGLVYWLTRNSWAAFFSAYAVSYTPYHLFASRGQIAGLLSAVFILALWQFLSLWRRPTWIKSIGLGAILGVGFYTDGYFILIGLVMLMSLWAASFSYELWVARSSFIVLVSRLKYLALATIVTGVMLLPFVWVNFRYAAQIESIFGSARGDIVANAQVYSAQLSMYINPKSLIFLGFSVVSFAAVGFILLLREHRRSDRQQLQNPDSRIFVGWVVTVMALLATWVSLRPKSELFGMTIYNPSALVITLTSSWRVFGRLYVLVIIGLAVLAGIGIARLMRRYPTRRYWIAGAATILLIAELAFFSQPAPAPNFNFRKAPDVYGWLRSNPRVRATAEYPLDEPPQGVYLSDYYTFQEISTKPLLNTLLPNSPQTSLRRSIAGINDPQTLPVLRSLGIDMINVRPVDFDGRTIDIRSIALANTDLDKVFWQDGRWNLASFIIKPGPVVNYALVIPTVQYSQIVPTVDGGVIYTLGDDTTLALVELPNAVKQSRVSVAFTVSADSSRSAVIVQNGVVMWSGTLDRTAQDVQLYVSPNYPLTIYNQRSSLPTQVNISKLQAH